MAASITAEDKGDAARGEDDELWVVIETGIAGNPVLTSLCHSVCECVFKKSPLIYILAVAIATRLNNFRSSSFKKTTDLPADSILLSLSHPARPSICH